MPKRRTSLRSGSDPTDNYLGSVSDLMAALTFVFILTVAVFALRLAETEVRVNAIIKMVQESRERLLTKIEDRLKRSEIQVNVDLDQGVLRIDEKGIYFVTGEATPAKDYQENIGKIARVLAEVLPCYVQPVAPSSQSDFERPPYCVQSPLVTLKCSPGDSHVDTVLIEGHTDTQPVRGNRGGNLELSARRSQEVFRMIAECEPSLEGLLNANKLRVLGVSGYGEHRPVPEAPDDKNRRIDLRFMMELPDLGLNDRSASVPVRGEVQRGIEK